MRYVQHSTGRQSTKIHDLQTPLLNLRHARFGQSMTTFSDDGVQQIGLVVSLKGRLIGCGQPTADDNLVHYDIDQGVQLSVPTRAEFVFGSIDREMMRSLAEQLDVVRCMTRPDDSSCG